MHKQRWLCWHKEVDTSIILNIARNKNLHDASTFAGMQEKYRRSKIAWLSDEKQISELIWPYVIQASETLGVKVTKIAKIQYTEYHGEQNGVYEWHHDVNWKNNNGLDRKLSVTIQLSDANDYKGGFFEFAEVEQPPKIIRDKGSILIFPSYLQHRVTPVTSGLRKSLVAWCEGPTWM